MACRPRGALSRALHAARSPTSSHRRRHSRSGRAHKHAHHVRLDVLRLRGHRLGGSPLGLVQVRSRGCDSRPRARRRAHLPRRHPSRQRRGYVTDNPLRSLQRAPRRASPSRARTPLPRPPGICHLPPRRVRMTWQTWPVAVPRSFAAATATRARDTPPHAHASALPRPRGRHPSARAVPRPIPASSSRPTPRAGRVVIPSRARRGPETRHVFSAPAPARSSPSVADPPHPSPGFEQRPRRTSR